MVSIDLIYQKQQQKIKYRLKATVKLIKQI